MAFIGFYSVRIPPPPPRFHIIFFLLKRLTKYFEEDIFLKIFYYFLLKLIRWSLLLKSSLPFEDKKWVTQLYRPIISRISKEVFSFRTRLWTCPLARHIFLLERIEESSIWTAELLLQFHICPCRPNGSTTSWHCPFHYLNARWWTGQFSFPATLKIKVASRKVHQK